MFHVEGTKPLDSNAIDFIDKGINFIGRTFENNGIQGKIERQHFEPNDPFTITATVIGNYKYVNFQVEPYYCSQNINKLTPKEVFSKWNEKIAYYFVTNIYKFVSLYNGQQGGYKLEDIKNHIVKIPITKHSGIDFEFIEMFVTDIEIEKIKKLESYLLSNNLSDCSLTFNEQMILDAFNNGKIEWKDFRIDELFCISSSRKKFDANKVEISEFGKPYVVRTALNNGIGGYINEDEMYLNEGKTISFGQDTATMFYQEEDYFTGDKIKILKLKDNDLNKKIGLFLISTMTKSFSAFSWGGNSFNVGIIGEQIMILPTKNQKPDYEAMENLMSAIQKKIIKNVFLYIDNKKNK